MVWRRQRGSLACLAVAMAWGCGIKENTPPSPYAVSAPERPPPVAPPEPPAAPGPGELLPPPTGRLERPEAPRGVDQGDRMPAPVTPWSRASMAVLAGDTDRVVITTEHVVGVVPIAGGFLAVGANGGQFVAPTIGRTLPRATSLPPALRWAGRFDDLIIACPERGNAWFSQDEGQGWARLDFPCGEDGRRTVAAGAPGFALLADGRLRIGHLPRGRFLARAIPLHDPMVLAAKDEHLVVFGAEAAAWSADGGAQLTPVALPEGAPHVRDAVIGLKGLVVAVGDGGAALVSRDGGRSWKVQPLPRRAESLGRVAIDAQGHILAVPHEPLGQAIISRDGGRSWTPVGHRGALRGGVAARSVGFEVGATQGVLARLDAAGDPALGLDQPLLTAVFVHPRRGLGVGVQDGLYRTDDGGRSWWRVPRTHGVRFTDADADDAGTLYAVGQGSLWRSTDLGQRWGYLAPASSCEVDWLRVRPQGDQVLVGCKDGRVHASHDAGDSWVATWTLADPVRRPVWIDARRVVGLGAQGRYLFASSNGGASWFARPVRAEEPPTSLTGGGRGITLAWADGRQQTAAWVTEALEPLTPLPLSGQLRQHLALRAGVVALDDAGVVRVEDGVHARFEAPDGYGMALTGDGGALVFQPGRTTWLRPR